MVFRYQTSSCLFIFVLQITKPLVGTWGSCSACNTGRQKILISKREVSGFKLYEPHSVLQTMNEALFPNSHCVFSTLQQHCRNKCPICLEESTGDAALFLITLLSKLELQWNKYKMSRRNVRTGQEKPHVTLLHLLLRKRCPRYECMHCSFSTCSALLGRITVQSQLGKMYIRDEQWKIINNKKQEGNFVNKSLLTDKKYTETTMGAHLGEHHSFTSHQTFKVAISLQ